ncbi:MAG: tetratricopeptide repeat protein, partial [Thermoplasmata archaeon]|nr:tetratricopeptide repeat protein [Thermoplasmata archaeon]
DRRGSALTLCGLALTNLGLKNTKTSLDQAKTALDIAIDIEVVSVEGKSRRILGQIYRVMEDWTLAEEMFQKSLELMEEIGNNNELVFTYYEHALLQIEQGQPDKARENLEKMLPMVKEMGMKLWEEKCKAALEGL